MIEVQVTVGVARDVRGRTRLDQRLELGEPLLQPFAQPLEDLRAHAGADVATGLVEVLPRVARHDLEPPVPADLRAARRARVELRDAPPGLLERALGEPPRPQVLQHRRVGREAPHLDRVFDRLPFSLELEPSLALHDRHDAEIDVGRQPTVQRDLLPTVVQPPLQRREVEEAQIDGLLHLVRVGPRQEDDRDVRLAHGRIGRAVRIRLGAGQVAYQSMNVQAPGLHDERACPAPASRTAGLGPRGRHAAVDWIREKIAKVPLRP